MGVIKGPQSTNKYSDTFNMDQGTISDGFDFCQLFFFEVDFGSQNQPRGGQHNWPFSCSVDLNTAITAPLRTSVHRKCFVRCARSFPTGYVMFNVALCQPNGVKCGPHLKFKKTKSSVFSMLRACIGCHKRLPEHE